MMSELRTRTAIIGDLSIILAILDDAARWLIAKGIRQWDSPPPADLAEFLKREVQAERVYLVDLLDQPATATFRLTTSDWSRWQDDGRDNALYVYSLAVRSTHHGHGLGTNILSWIKRTAQAQGRVAVRLDCWTKNDNLKQYYARLGFQHRGDVEDAGYPLSLYEIRLQRTAESS